MKIDKNKLFFLVWHDPQCISRSGFLRINRESLAESGEATPRERRVIGARKIHRPSRIFALVIPKRKLIVKQKFIQT